MAERFSPDGVYDVFADDGFSIMAPDVEDDPRIGSELGIVPPVTMVQTEIAPGETLGDFTRRMYGANTERGRTAIARANDVLKGTVNVPLP